jgi:hypothetical protein
VVLPVVVLLAAAFGAAFLLAPFTAAAFLTAFLLAAPFAAAPLAAPLLATLPLPPPKIAAQPAAYFSLVPTRVIVIFTPQSFSKFFSSKSSANSSDTFSY